MRTVGLRLDAKPVIDSMDPVKRDALSHAGARVRQTARRSIRRRKGVSRPGRPPHSHVGTLRRLIFYAWDGESESVVIGPLRFGEGGAEDLEHGGTVRVRTRRGRGRTVRAAIEPRPFMGPAQAEVEPEMAGFWAQARAKQGRG